MPNPDHKLRIEQAAAEIVRLHGRIHATFAHRHEGPAKNREWQNACSDFRARYDALSFPGGESKIERITDGDPDAMEAALCFLECRPYFFRSGYLFKRLLRRAKRAPLSDSQQQRLALVIERQAAWQKRKRSSALEDVERQEG